MRRNIVIDHLSLPQERLLVARCLRVRRGCAGVGDAKAWGPAQFGNDLGFLAHGDGAVRMVAALTKM